MRKPPSVAQPAPQSSDVPRAQACARSASVTDITVEHGPVDLLGRFFLKADTAARERGVTLSFGTFEELLRGQRAEPRQLGT